MTWGHVLIWTDSAEDLEPSIIAVARAFPTLSALTVMVARPDVLPRGTPAELPPDLQARITDIAPQLFVRVLPAVGRGSLVAFCRGRAVELIIFRKRSWLTLSLGRMLRLEAQVAVLWHDRDLPLVSPLHYGCLALTRLTREGITRFVLTRVPANGHVELFAGAGGAELVELLRSSGSRAALSAVAPTQAGSPLAWIERAQRQRRFDVLVLGRLSAAVALGRLWAGPLLLLPRPDRAAASSLDIADLAVMGAVARVQVDRIDAAGSLAVAAPPVLTARWDCGAPESVPADGSGTLRVPPAATEGWLRLGDAGRACANAEARARLVRPGTERVLLFDATLPHPELLDLQAAAQANGHRPIAVRLRPNVSCRRLRRQLDRARLPPIVLDARAVLDEGDALDVSEQLDSVRLIRVAKALERADFVPGIVVARQGGATIPWPWRPLQRHLPSPAVSSSLHEFNAFGQSPAAESQFKGASPLSTARSGEHQVELEAHNPTARQWLVDLVDGAQTNLSVQVYMVADDPLAARVEAALVAAAERGVAVRFLVDSLHSLHGSFGARNPMLDRLAQHQNVEVRALAPLAGVPNLVELKRRDHTKLVIADGQVALLGGRNLAHEYYAGFSEVSVSASSHWREVPWLDTGARVAGPLVAELGGLFLANWTAAGGAPFDIPNAAPTGTSSVRLVQHQGLRDCHTLESYRALIEESSRRLVLVSGFPLVLELQHVLLAALRRGVQVEVLTGHMAPTHGTTPFPGDWVPVRALATEVVHSRLDPLIARGADVFLFEQQSPSWAPGLGVVRPHVHGKALCADGQRCAIGSANLDITSSYWESEVLLLVEDARVVGDFEQQLRALMAVSSRVDRTNPAWLRAATERAWMRHWPGVFAV